MTGARGRARPRVPRARVPEAAAQLHLVGQPQGRRGQQPLRRRLPRARQHRRVRPLAAAARPAATSSRPTARPGWRSTARPCCRWRSSWRSDDPAYEDVASKFFEHFVAIADAMNTLGGTGPVGRGGRLLLRPAPSSTATPIAAARALDGRASSRCSRSRCSRTRRSSSCPASEAACTGSSRTAPTRAAHRRTAGTARRHGARACWRSPRASGSSACCATCSTRTSSSRRTASARSRGSTREHPVRASTSTATSYRVDYAPGESDHRPVRRQLELARPGLVPGQLPADRGARALPPLLRRRAARSSARPARAACMTLQRGRRRARARGWRALFLPDASGRRPCHGDDARYADDPHWRDLVLFHEYFHGDNGRGLGASHQTGWTRAAPRNAASRSASR